MTFTPAPRIPSPPSIASFTPPALDDTDGEMLSTSRHTLARHLVSHPDAMPVLLERAIYRAWRTEALALRARNVLPGGSHRVDGSISTTGAFRPITELGDDNTPLCLLARTAHPDRLERIGFPPRDPVFRALVHVCSPLCRPRHFVGALVPLTARGLDTAHSLAAAAPQVGGCRTGVPAALGELAAYHTLVGRLGLRAERTWPLLGDHCYPLDATVANLAVFSDMVMPSLRSFKEWSLLVVARSQPGEVSDQP